MKYLFFILYSCFTYSLWSQNQTSSSPTSKIEQISQLNQLAREANSSYDSSAYQYAKTALSLSLSENFQQGQAESLAHLGYFYIISAQYDSGLYFLNQGISVAEKNELRELSADLFKKKAAAHFYKGSTDSALFYFKTSLSQYEELKDSLEVIKLFNNIGAISLRKGDLNGALEAFLRCLTFDEKKMDQSAIASDCNNIGIVFTDKWDFKSATTYLNRCIAIRTELRDTAGLVGAHINLGNIGIKSKEFSMGLKHFLNAYDLADSASNPYRHAQILHSIGLSYFHLNKNNQALTFLKRSIANKRAMGDKNGIGSDLGIMGELYFKLGEIEKAKNCSEESLTLATETEDLEYQMNALRNLVNVYIQLGKPEMSKAAFQQFILTRDSIYNETSSQQVAELQTQYETEKKDHEIKTLKTESELKELQIAQTRTLVIAILVIATLILVILLFFNRQRRLKLLAQMAQEKEQLQKERFRVVIDTEENERKRVARELHDGLGQMLSTVRLFVSDLDETNENPKVERSLKALDSTIEEVRSISHNMMPIKLIELGLPAAIEEMANRINESNKIKIHLENTSLLNLPDTESVALYRTIQEIVNNAIKYAQAKLITIGASETRSELHVVIKDDGQGFNTENIAKSKGIGWSNIYARMDLIGAQVNVVSKKDEGTNVNLTLPVKGTNVRSA